MASWSGLILVFALAVGACATQPPVAPGGTAFAATRHVFVVRHMQKQSGDDPALSAEGEAGARRLAAMLADKGIVAIFATRTRRAMATAAPLGQRLGIAVTPYDPRSPELLAAAVSAAPGPVLVVGHSNTVHDLVGRFGGTPPPPLTEQDYGTVFMVKADGGVATMAVR
ncbi:MAG: histidine phosphatase family protein [Sphingomonas sp.]|nr:histidine phosphatase family protein [Sphingomonas sp.]